MSLDISVPGGNPNKPGFSVQRSANGLSISAGDLASTNTMFGMANDEGGLSLSAWPVALGKVAPGEAEYNLCPCPNAQPGAWPYGWVMVHPTSSTSNVTSTTLSGFDTYPPGFRNGTTAVLCVLPNSEQYDGLIPDVEYQIAFDAAIPPDWKMLFCSAYWFSCSEFLSGEGPYQVDPAVLDGFSFEFFSSTGASLGSGMEFTVTGLTQDNEAWVYTTSSVIVPPGSASVRTFLTFMLPDPRFSWLFLCDVMLTDVESEFADGDSPGWTWDGTPHNSSSRSLA